jgi:hypothetical protein
MEALQIQSKATGKLAFQVMLTPRGVATTDVYAALNQAVAPLRVLLYAAFDKINEIFHRPRITGGLFYYELVTSYPSGMDPFIMIREKLAFKAQKRAIREHNSQALAAMVGKLLFQKSPQTFRALADEVVNKVGRTEPFWGGTPTTEEQMRQLLRYYNVDGPGYRAAPLGFKLNPEQLAILTERMRT